MPKRIQIKRVKGWRLPPNAVAVTRPGKFGNPFKVGQRIPDDAVPNGYTILDAAFCLELFENHCNLELMDNPAWLNELRGKDLACYCPVMKNGEYVPCHADVLLSLANDIPLAEVKRINAQEFERLSKAQKQNSDELNNGRNAVKRKTAKQKPDPQAAAKNSMKVYELQRTAKNGERFVLFTPKGMFDCVWKDVAKGLFRADVLQIGRLSGWLDVYVDEVWQFRVAKE